MAFIAFSLCASSAYLLNDALDAHEATSGWDEETYQGIHRGADYLRAMGRHEDALGRDLRAALRGGWRPEPHRAARLVRRVADALAFAHARGVVHCDVKPANILTLTQGHSTEIHDIKLTDFGSALNLTSDATQVHRVGSLAYMSPEQLDGSQLDARADIYSLGAVLYHLIAGHAPFEASSQASLMHQICHVQPVSLVGLRAGVSTALDQVVQRCLSKRADQRYGSAQAFRQALLAGQLAGHDPAQRLGRHRLIQRRVHRGAELPVLADLLGRQAEGVGQLLAAFGGVEDVGHFRWQLQRHAWQDR